MPDEPCAQRPVVDFGQAQAGDVRSGDIVGGDKITHIHQAGPVFHVPYPLNPHFRGRDDELGRLAELLLAEASWWRPLPALAGTGGIGKTQLASEFAQRERGTGACPERS